jgi:hypothetical protein
MQVGVADAAKQDLNLNVSGSEFASIEGERSERAGLVESGERVRSTRVMPRA